MQRYLHIFASLLCLLFTMTPVKAAEETEFSWPLGPIGGKFRIWTDESFIRVSEITPGAPGATAGLQVNDMITGAFGKAFDPINAAKLNGPVRQLGAAIDYAETNQTPLVLSVLRPGTGQLSISVNLPATSGLGPAYTRTSSRYEAIYETSCAALHARIMADADGDIGYPTGLVALGLLGHPNWNDTTGAKPYRLSVNKLRDWAIAKINSAILTPVEANFYDGSANPQYVDAGLENWALGLAVMYFSEYVAKTGEQALYQTTLQRGAVLMANRIQNWAQPDNGGTADLSYATTRGATGHGGVVGDYTHQWYVGINITGLHLFNGLAMAKRAGADMTERPKDGHYFGYTLNPGDAIPAKITTALPSTIVLPRGAEDSRSLPHINNTTNAPLTTITTVDASNNPFYYDLSLGQKFWLQWDCLTRSTGANGNVGYAAVTGGAYDAGGRTPGSLLGYKIFQDGATPSALDLDVINRQMNYIVSAHDIHLNSHAYNMGGACFTAMLMPYFSDRNQLFFLENWKCFNNLAAQPNGSIEYVRGRDFGDPYMDTTDSMHADIALAGSVARGGLPHIPGFNTNRVMVHAKKPLMDWPTPEARRIRLSPGETSTAIDLDLVDGNGAVISPASITAAWSVVSGPTTSGVIASPTSLDTNASFTLPGTYRLQLDASAGALSTQETFDVVVLPAAIPGYVMGEADYAVYSDIAGIEITDLTSNSKFPNSPDLTSNLTSLEGTHGGNTYGSTITCVVIPPVTGNYRFYIASDDKSQLLFNSSGASAAGATVIASVSDWTNARQWNKYSSQQSAVISLTAGQPYYLRALHKEGSGGDNLAIAWTTPTDSTITVIGSTSIARAEVVETAAITTQPANQTINLGDTATFSIAVTGPEPRFFQWRRNGVNFTLGDSTLTLNNAGALLAGTWDCVYTSGNTVITSNPVTLTINGVGTLQTGGLWQEVYNNVGGTTVDSLLQHANYPMLSTSSGILAQPATSTLGDDYGQRWSGWIIPSTSGRYRFYAAADDATSLYLSPTPYEAHKVLIHSITSYTNEKQWSARSPSAWIQMEAGQRYFVEFFHKEAGGGDHAAFTWQKEGDPVPTDGAGLIPSANLQYAFGGTLPDGATAPPFAVADDLSLIATNGPYTITPLTNDLDANLSSLVITSVTQPSSGSLTIAPNGKSLTFTPANDDLGVVTATYTITNSLNLTSTANITIQLSGGLWQQKYDGITGPTVADLTNNVAFPNSPTTQGIRTNAYISQLGSNFGVAWTGWVVPSVSGNYRFYMTCDKQADLYFSTTPYASHQQLIISRTSYISERVWSTNAMSQYFPLVAGQRYYIRALVKESTGNDQLALAWQREGDAVPASGGGELTAVNLRARINGYHVDDAPVAPLAVNDNYTVAGHAYATTELTPLANDLDANLNALTITSVTSPSLGSLSISADGKKLLYQPGLVAGTTSATYTVSDGALTATATITIEVRDLSSGLQAYWRMNEGSGTTTVDSSGSNRTATLVSSPTWTTGKLGGGIGFNGTSQYLTVTGSTTPSTLTISAWIKPTGVTGTQSILSQGSAFSFRTFDNRLRFTTLGLVDYTTPSGTALVTANVWQHVAVSFTPNATGGLKFYVNGVLRHTANTTGMNSNTNVWQIARTNTSEYFAGSLDEVRLYNRVVSAEEIASLANSATPFEDWRSVVFPVAQLDNWSRTSPSSDYDNDGIPNLLEYAFGTNPALAASGPGQVAHNAGSITALAQPTVQMTTLANGADYRAIFARRKDFATAGLGYTVQFSADMQDWTNGADAPTVLASDASMDVVSVPYPFFVSSPEGFKKARFFRVSISLSP